LLFGGKKTSKDDRQDDSELGNSIKPSLDIIIRTVSTAGLLQIHRSPAWAVRQAELKKVGSIRNSTFRAKALPFKRKTRFILRARRENHHRSQFLFKALPFKRKTRFILRARRENHHRSQFLLNVLRLIGHCSSHSTYTQLPRLYQTFHSVGIEVSRSFLTQMPNKDLLEIHKFLGVTLSCHN
jgi:hypothetical protein